MDFVADKFDFTCVDGRPDAQSQGGNSLATRQGASNSSSSTIEDGQHAIPGELGHSTAELVGGDPVKTRSGTPPYQAPDADYTRWDVSTDLFAVGVVLYQLLCNGEHPYEGGTPMVGEAVRDPRSIRSDLNGDLVKFLVNACAPNRADRFATAQEMKVALEEIRVTG